MGKKENAFKRFFKKINRLIINFFCFLFYIIVWPILKICVRCKIKGKENINSEDEARIFVANHYEMYGPIAMYLNFHIKFRPWIIDKMLEPELITERMKLMAYQNFKHFPKWFKNLVINIVKEPIIYILSKKAKGISVSQNNLKANLKTFKITAETLEKNQAVLIFPEYTYVKEGVGTFQSGFEHVAKYYYKQTGKKITFYPIFISKINKTINVEKPIVYNPENENNFEKERIVTYLRNEMVHSYETNEVNTKKYVKRKEKQRKKMLKKNNSKKAKKINNEEINNEEKFE